LGGEAPVYDQEIAIKDARIPHAIACNFEQEGGGAVRDQVAVEVDLTFEVVVSGTWKARADAVQEKRDVDLIAVDHPQRVHPDRSPLPA
jgi:hypothetical protein